MINKTALKIALIFNLFWVSSIYGQPYLLEALVPMPMATTNNAVVEGFRGDTCMVFSFGGIDSTLKFDGIHQKCFAFNTLTNEWKTLSDLPDTLGKVAMSANRVGDTIFIVGGYHVYANGNEKSSFKVHRFDVNAMQFISDWADLPFSTDDQVQMVINEKIYVITGWSDNGNITNVQVYNTRLDTWQQSAPLPNDARYLSFFASGAYSPFDTSIYYLGGAYSIGSFKPQRFLRRGAIQPDNSINWTIESIDDMFYSYRNISLKQGSRSILWFGGGKDTYNYNGRSYANNSFVEPTHNIIEYRPDLNQFNVAFNDARIPMDLRGVGVDGASYYLCGGMQENGKVYNQLLRINYNMLNVKEQYEPNVKIDFNQKLKLVSIINGSQQKPIEVFNLKGKRLLFEPVKNQLSLSSLTARIYIVRNGKTSKKVVIAD